MRTEKSRYVFISPWPVRPGAGVNNVILGLAAAMQHRFEPVIAVSGWDRPPVGQIWLKLSSPAFSLRSFAGFVAQLVPNSIRLRRVLRDAVAVNPHYPGLEILPLVLLRRVGLSPKLIISVHGSDMTEILCSSRVSRCLHSFMLSNADLVVACSRSLAQKVLQFNPRARVVSIWNAAPPPSAFAGQTRLMESRYILCVGAFTRNKGHDVLLHAFRQICPAEPDLQLVIIGGEGPARLSLIKMIADLGLAGKVRLLVNLPQEMVWQWERYAECLILPSRNEGFGICLLEAGMLHTPVIATRVGGIPEFIVDGVHGLLCEPDQPQELASAILNTLSDPVAARKRADAFYERARDLTWEKAFERYCEAAALP